MDKDGSEKIWPFYIVHIKKLQWLISIRFLNLNFIYFEYLSFILFKKQV